MKQKGRVHAYVLLCNEGHGVQRIVLPREFDSSRKGHLGFEVCDSCVGSLACCAC